MLGRLEESLKQKPPHMQTSGRGAASQLIFVGGRSDAMCLVWVEYMDVIDYICIDSCASVDHGTLDLRQVRFASF